MKIGDIVTWKQGDRLLVEECWKVISKEEAVEWYKKRKLNYVPKTLNGVKRKIIYLKCISSHTDVKGEIGWMPLDQLVKVGKAAKLLYGKK